MFNKAHAKEGSQKCLFSDCLILTDERILVEKGF